MRQIILNRIRSFEIGEVDLSDATEDVADTYAALAAQPGGSDNG